MTQGASSHGWPALRHKREVNGSTFELRWRGCVTGHALGASKLRRVRKCALEGGEKIASCVMEPDPNFDAAVPAASAAPPTPRIVLEARSLKKTYGAGARSLPVLVDANLSLRQGEMTAIVAPSGPGTTTSLHLLPPLHPPTT